MNETKRTDLLPRIPKVDELLLDARMTALLANAPRWAVLDGVREETDELRTRILGGTVSITEADLETSAVVARVFTRVQRLMRHGLREVINATGIIVHTNLGRAVLPPEAVVRLTEVALGYTNLEFDLAAGKRGSRHSHLKPLLRRLTGAEDALVVNNNAAAVLLVLNTLARGREAVVSRGELVEIGGSFRIPDVMARSGAILREVGSTNKTHPRDYEEAIGPNTAMLLKVHTSNYRVVGFTSEVTLPELAAIGRKHNVPVVEDLGSGCLVDLSAYGLGDEPPVGKSVKAGADLVTFSGDKLLGGPQAGIIVGRADLVKLVAANPLHRALRIDKFTAAALEAVLRLYLDGERAMQTIPVLSMIALPAPAVRRRVASLIRRCRGNAPAHLHFEAVSTISHVGGGSLPTRGIPSWALAVTSDRLGVQEIERLLRAAEPAVIGRIEDDRLLLDLRTVPPADLPLVARALSALPA